MKKRVTALIGAGLLSTQIGATYATATAEEAKKLGTTLTMIGAEKAGNKDGTIPEYTGGLTTAPAGFDKSKNLRPDPFANEKPLFSINAKNMDKYADKMTEGTKALMKLHADYRIDVYPTHRTAGYPKSVLENTVKNATRAKLSDDGLSMIGARAGIPFPIPKNGNEVMLNYIGRYNGGTTVIPKFSAYNVGSGGNVMLSAQGIYMQESVYYDESRPEPTLMNRVRTSYTAPVRRAGEAAMTAEPIDNANESRRAYQYLPGQRRVRLAPDLNYDTPNASTSGMSTYDDVNLFNGKLDRFDWKLVGKKEMYVPYNAYRFLYNGKPEDVFQAKFINPDTVRWELHRVWVVEASVKEGKRHIYSKRTYYIDEDTWFILASDQYDGRGQLWRPGFSYMTQSYDVPTPTHFTSGHYDVIAGSYYVNQWPGSNGIKIGGKPMADSFWTPESLAGSGIR
ncbi:DUF1329 domain-containing protein [Noviherbaspirillum saxi]|uniref:DUF1329 domain-containing protein n=1 Tax=Noviherbaspirillum saxi TaxID=2320863 RepID=A0A3A3FQQ6_9BURK|nr:DUF1329 domain-containing protein [Noviherbaspirillum saxi]RJF98547.1 DUF1329 domain-containing protein [Noviherbaspirillum saxi]